MKARSITGIKAVKYTELANKMIRSNFATPEEKTSVS